MGTAVRVVLDTNVLLSLFVFADSRYAPLRGRLDAGEWRALTDGRCLHEFRRVLTYPMFSLDAAAQAAAYEAYARLAETVTAAVDPVVLPECEDPDDQKFLEVARDGKAQWLVTSDKALLKLARRRKLAHLFGIVTPKAALTIDLHT
ncbi:MAG: putative toxin-antitoxin system toxin component, PIN family [Rhodocyclales bacterium]|nr:putative toxin-antitoxin system toxin component, PIN family [Rhodocyclales bacterium]